MIRALQSPIVHSLASAAGRRAAAGMASARRSGAPVGLSEDVVAANGDTYLPVSYTGLGGLNHPAPQPTKEAKTFTEVGKTLPETAKATEVAKTITVRRVSELRQLTHGAAITELKLSNIHLQDAQLAHLARLPTVKAIDLSYNQISNLGLAAVMQHLPQLERIDLTEAGKLSIYGLRALRSAGKLRSVRLGGPTMVTDANVHELNGILPPQLEKLDLHGAAKLSDAAIPHLLKLPPVREFQLFASGLSATGKKNLMSALGFGADGKRAVK